MFPREDSNEVLEKGAMVNPSTEKLTEYEELWQDLHPVRVGDEKEFVSWVLKTENSNRNIRGMAIRIGEWIEGVLRIDDQISVVRWQWSTGKGWERLLAIGQLQLNQDVFSEKEIFLGQVFAGDGLTWDCIESFRWT